MFLKKSSWELSGKHPRLVTVANFPSFQNKCSAPVKGSSCMCLIKKSKMELFAKIVNVYKPLTVFTKTPLYLNISFVRLLVAQRAVIPWTLFCDGFCFYKRWMSSNSKSFLFFVFLVASSSLDACTFCFTKMTLNYTLISTSFQST